MQKKNGDIGVIERLYLKNPVKVYRVFLFFIFKFCFFSFFLTVLTPNFYNTSNTVKRDIAVINEITRPSRWWGLSKDTIGWAEFVIFLILRPAEEIYRFFVRIACSLESVCVCVLLVFVFVCVSVCVFMSGGGRGPWLCLSICLNCLSVLVGGWWWRVTHPHLRFPPYPLLIWPETFWRKKGRRSVPEKEMP